MGLSKEILSIGKIVKGDKNLISDVPGVLVGHRSIRCEASKTGVTVILPHSGNLFEEKVVANTHVLNGFGKSAGLIQIAELGTIETPIVLTNTLSVGEAVAGLTAYMLEQNEAIGREGGTVNPIVCECNDGVISDIRRMQVSREDVFLALQEARESEGRVEEGSVGAGTGMICYGLKGGIGSASRRVSFGTESYTLGVLVLANFGDPRWLRVNGMDIGEFWTQREKSLNLSDEKGSVIIVIATDIPMDSRQLGRLCRRAAVGLARTGSYIGHGSGDLAIAFTTVNKIYRQEKDYFIQQKVLNEEKMDRVFRATAESIEESVLSAMLHAEADCSRTGERIPCLKEILREYNKKFH